MKKGIDLICNFQEIFVVHHNLPGKALTKDNKDEHHLIIPLSGEITVTTNGETFKLASGKMIYIPQSYPHQFESNADQNGERLIAIVKDDFIKPLKLNLTHPKVLMRSNLIKELLLFLLTHPNCTHHKEICLTIMKTIEDLIQTPHMDMDKFQHLYAKTEDERLKKALDYITMNYTSQITASDLSLASAMSNRNLNRLFTGHFTMTPKQLITQLKMEKALELIKTTELSITEICYEVGLNSLSNFITTFYKTFHKIPTDFR